MLEKACYLRCHFTPDASYKSMCTQTIVWNKTGKSYNLVFQKSWLKQYSWLVYSPAAGGGLCKYCALLMPNNQYNKMGCSCNFLLFRTYSFNWMSTNSHWKAGPNWNASRGSFRKTKMYIFTHFAHFLKLFSNFFSVCAYSFCIMSSMSHNELDPIEMI